MRLSNFNMSALVVETTTSGAKLQIYFETTKEISEKVLTINFFGDYLELYSLTL